MIYSVRESDGIVVGCFGEIGLIVNFKFDWVNYYIKIVFCVIIGEFEFLLFGCLVFWFRFELYNLFKELIF